MPSEIRAVTDANWAGELEGLRSTSCGWIYFGDHLLETYSSTQQIVALSTAESEWILITRGAAHALEVRSATVDFGLTSNVVCETDASAGRAMATRRGVGRVRHLVARLLWLQQLCAEGVVQVRAGPGELNEADLGTKMVDLRRMTSLLKGTPLRPPKGWSSWMVAATLPRGCGDSPRLQRQQKIAVYLSGTCEEYVRDERLVLDLCVKVLVILMVLSGRPSANSIGQMTEVGRRRPTRMLRNYVQWKMSSSIMRRYPGPDSAWSLIACDAELWNCGYEICQNRLDGSAVHPVCVKTRPSIKRRQSEM